MKDRIKRTILQKYPEAIQSSISIKNIVMHPIETGLVRSFEFSFNERDYYQTFNGLIMSAKMRYVKRKGFYNPEKEFQLIAKEAV